MRRPGADSAALHAAFTSRSRHRRLLTAAAPAAPPAPPQNPAPTPPPTAATAPTPQTDFPPPLTSGRASPANKQLGMRRRKHIGTHRLQPLKRATIVRHNSRILRVRRQPVRGRARTAEKIARAHRLRHPSPHPACAPADYPALCGRRVNSVMCHPTRSNDFSQRIDVSKRPHRVRSASRGIWHLATSLTNTNLKRLIHPMPCRKQ
jgi:hypothetical protein